MFCKFCGKQLEDDWQFCPKCGNPVDGLTRESFERKIERIERDSFQTVSDPVLYVVIQKETGCVKSYSGNLARCNMDSVDYIAAVHIGHWITVGGNRGTSYSLIGFYDRNFKQIDAIPASDTLELYGFNYGEWYKMSYHFRDKVTKREVGHTYYEPTLALMIEKFSR